MTEPTADTISSTQSDAAMEEFRREARARYMANMAAVVTGFLLVCRFYWHVVHLECSKR
jgi:hypothetical protein